MHCNFLLFTLVFNVWLPLENMGEEVYLSLFNNMYMVYILKENTYKEVKVAKLDHEPHIKKHPSNKSNSKGGNNLWLANYIYIYIYMKTLTL